MTLLLAVIPKSPVCIARQGLFKKNKIMEKILYVTDAITLHKPSLEFACFLGNLTHSRIVGIFLENMELEDRSKETIQEKSLTAAPAGASVREMKEDCCKENIRRFREICEAGGVQFSVHRDRGTPVTEVLAESRYADLIITDADTSFKPQRETVPTGFVKDVLQQAECPVVIAPEGFDGLNEIIFTYDNSRSSVFAIKQFTYLFPQLGSKQAVMLNITPPGKDVNTDKYKLKEWLKLHYEHIDMVTLEDGNIKARLLEYLLTRKKVFIVMGAFGRSMLSYFFVPSHAAQVVKFVTQPVFIAHY